MKPGILVVDDSLTVRMNLGEAFEAAGFAAVPCATVAEAREALARSPFALVVLDVLLPDGDGIEFLRELKAGPATAEVPVMLLSSKAEVKDRVEGLRIGADEYVGKPYDPAYVVARALEIVRAREPRQESRAAPPILVIDDSATFREEIRAAIERAGHAVVTAETGEEGLRSAAAVRPAAVIVDGVMPGIDGATVIRRLRLDAALRRTPCVLLTASEAANSEVQALDSGADAYIRKDEDTAVILARLAALLRSTTAPTDAEGTPSALGPKKILAVDDSLTYLEEIGAQLRQEGYDVILARSGQESLEVLAVQAVHCILMDMIMPGLSGQDTCRRIKGSPAWRDIPLVMLTAREDREAVIEGINAGADDFIPKSSDFEVLVARLRAQLRRKQFEDENRSIREELLRKEAEAAEARVVRELAETRAALLADLRRTNEELEAFSYSVSHDLRAPLRAIHGFSRALAEDCADKLDEQGRRYLRNVCDASKHMGQLIDDLLDLSRVTRHEMRRERTDLSALARAAAEELRRTAPERQAEFAIAEGLVAMGDSHLLRIAIENLLGNAWKYTAKHPRARIEFGLAEKDGGPAYFVRDDGAGFDMAHAGKLFAPFQRLHSDRDFPGTGIGLATVQRIIRRHGGLIWAEGKVEGGATFHFTLPEKTL